MEDERSKSAELSLHSQVVRSRVSERLFGPGRTPSVTLGRYRLLGLLGHGGMGSVFEAEPMEGGQRVALKVLHQSGPHALRQLKREFRALADLLHPNLVQLYELSVDDPRKPFFTMEHVRGEPLLAHVRPGGRCDPARLKAVLRQVVDAVTALHLAGRLHRDLKPSNLLVEHGGRVVVLDFGLSRAIGEVGGGTGSGTPVYMAPEQLRGLSATTASDWYAVGVVLHQALHGHAPGREPSRLAHSGPTSSAANLDALCLQLLAADPAGRPSGPALREALGLPAVPAVASPIRPLAAGATFIGRVAELEGLHAAWARAREGRCELVYVDSEPGLGKSALVGRFIQQLEQSDTPALVLASRCHERELISYNALDGVLDGVVRALRGLEDSAREALQPAATSELLRLFPALGEAFPWVTARSGALGTTDVHGLRQRGFAALQQLISAIAGERPILIHLDDVQWGDADSGQLLVDLIERSCELPWLLVVSYRSREASGSACLQRLHQLHPHGAPNVGTLSLAALSEVDLLELGRVLGHGQLDDSTLRELAREAGGSPLFLRALLEQQRASAGVGVPVATSLRDLLTAATARLAEPSRELLQLIALAGRPIERSLLLRAAQRAGSDERWEHHLALLRMTGLVRAVSAATEEAFESYHDRVRETVDDSLPDSLRRIQHARLAGAELDSPSPDPEFLTHQYARAGSAELTSHYAELAAERASGQLAFEHAGELYDLAIEHSAVPRPDLLRKRADALAHAGLTVAAAAAYVRAADHLPDGTEQHDLRRRAAELFLSSGRIADGLAIVRPLLRTVGLRYPDSTWRVVASLAFSHLWLKLRGLAFEPAPELHAAERQQLDLCISTGIGLLTVDETGGAVALMLKALRMALASGDARGVAMSLPIYANARSWNPSDPRSIERLFSRAEELGRQLEDAEIESWVLVVRGATALQSCQWSLTLELALRAQAQLQTSRDGGFKLGSARHFQIASLHYIGQLRELDTVARDAASWAGSRGDRWLTATALIYGALARLGAGDGPTALRQVEHAAKLWANEVDEGRRDRSQRTLQQIELHALPVHIYCLLYNEDPIAAYRLFARQWRRLDRGLGVHLLRGWQALVNLTRGATALAATVAGYRSAEALALAQRSALTLGRMPNPSWASAGAALIDAGLHNLRGDTEHAAELLRRADREFTASNMQLYAAAARMRLGDLEGGTSGALRIAQTRAQMQALGVVDPERWTRMYAPGF